MSLTLKKYSMQSKTSLKITVVVPTYNEAFNIKGLLVRLNELYPSFSIIVVDDNSPDGTYKIVESIKSSIPSIEPILRLTDRERGYAGKAGFSSALERGSDIIVEMEADSSHRPEDLPGLLKCLEKGGSVLGSKYYGSGNGKRASKARKAISYLSTLIYKDFAKN